jgi:His/Glu/Gln/Arg/opine family amino acid ABC transporter permease subunit
MDGIGTILYTAAPLLLRGLLVTIKFWLISAALGFSIGTALGTLSCRKLRMPLLGALIDFMTFILRAIPFYVQLLIAYFVLPDLIGLNLEPAQAAILSLGLCSGAYVSQIVRTGINSIPSGQWDACFALGYSTWATLRFIILPQMLSNVLPAFVNELDYLIKSTAIISSIGIVELTRAGMNIISRGNDPIIIYLAVAVLYILVSLVFNLIGKRLERRLRYDSR